MLGARFKEDKEVDKHTSRSRSPIPYTPKKRKKKKKPKNRSRGKKSQTVGVSKSRKDNNFSRKSGTVIIKEESDIANEENVEIVIK